jgi:PAS domain S-box-containing protein
MTASRILIVQDERTVSEDLAERLRASGYEAVEIVASGKDAVLKAESIQPDMLLIDVVLRGGMDGIEAASRIRAHLDIPIVYLTALTEKDIFERAKTTEPCGYLSRPVSPQNLLSTVDMAFYKHKMEKRLKKSEEKYRTLFEESRDAVYITTRDGEALDVNRSFLDLFGYSRQEIVGAGISHIYVDVNDRKSFQEDIERAGSVKDYETRFRRKDGIVLDCLETASVRRGEDGTILGYQGIIRDITERKEVEEALRQSEERLRLKLDYILSPEEQVEGITLPDLIDSRHLQQIQDSFAKATGVASIISDVDGNPITKASNFCGVCQAVRATEKGNRRCIESDKILGEKARRLLRPTYQECLSCGFVDASAPIIVAGQHIANWLIGQSNVMGVDRRRIEEYADEIAANPHEMLRSYDSMLDMSLDRFKDILDLLWHFAREISSLGYNNLKLARELTHRRHAEDALQKAHDELELRVEERTAELLKANELLETEISERKRAEEALKRAHDELEQRVKERTEFNEKILATSSVGITTYRSSGLCVSGNEAMAVIQGASRDELLKQNFRELASWERADLLADAEQVLSHGGTRRKEVHLVSTFGKEVWLDCRFNRFTSGGEPHLLLIADDITDRKQAEEHVRDLTQALIRAQECERERISRDLHDNLAQDLSSLRISYEMFLDDLGQLSSHMKSRGAQLSKMIHQSITAVRDLSHGLRPRGLDQMGLVRTISRYCKDFSAKTGLQVDFHSPLVNELQLDADTAINLFRVVQEALRNVGKHAQAGHVSVALKASFPNIALRIEDDGTGFDVNARSFRALTEKRMGLWCMRERVSLLRGEMKIQSCPMQGTKILVEVPWKEKGCESRQECLDRR